MTSRLAVQSSLVLLVLQLLLCSSRIRAAQRGNGLCPNETPIEYDSSRHEPVYKVGVLAIRGFDAARREFTKTFDDYLTATVGPRFSPPLRFEMKPLDFQTLFIDSENQGVDFLYVNPSAFSCIESEYTARSLVSQMSRRTVHGETYDLQKFGGVIMVRNDSHIDQLTDLNDKIIAAASISGLGSGEMQFLEMQNAGMSYIQDPKQLVFTSNQEDVVNGVLSGEFDVGFVRTDQIERTTNSHGTLVDPNAFRVINAKANLTADGNTPFPFVSSTPLYPEWNVAALDHVPDAVLQEVQSALLALSEHAAVGKALEACQQQLRTNNTEYCFSQLRNSTVVRCDTTPEIANLAVQAMTHGKYAKWQTTLSYMQLRSMQEVTGFIKQDPITKTWQCVRSTNIYDNIVCPQGYKLNPENRVGRSCSLHNLVCKEGYQCICKPCSLIGVCVDGVKMRGECVPYKTILPAILIPLFVICAILVHFYVEYKREQADSVWAVKPNELHFDTPRKVIGVGTFGFVLAAEYRGTKVAVKRVIPPKNGIQRKSISNPLAAESGRNISDVDNGSDIIYDGDIESQNQLSPGLKSMSRLVMQRQREAMNEGQCPTSSQDRHYFSTMTRRQPTHTELKAEFVREMRHLAKLRHPCITTFMGAVISKNAEPMLVMEYMELGSLYDVLRSDVALDNDEHIMPILQDIAQGIRFLHAAEPQVVHGDLKAKNVLIDANYRAKVTDFGLSAKKTSYASGTPYWMAPELLHRKSPNTAQSDMYAFAILMYEVYSRQNPYEAEDYNEVLLKVCDPSIIYRPSVPATCTQKVAELMRACWSAKPEDRPTAEHVDVLLRVEGGVKERTSRLEKLNRELEKANEKIAAASTMQLEHFACMSHEIRTPLNCIVGLSSLMENAEISQSQKESMEMIASSSILLQSIVDDVLDFAKLQSGNAEVDIKKTDVQGVITELVNLMRANVIVRKRNVTIRTNYHPSVSRYIDTDGRRLLQVLFNLVSNAAKFSKDNGIVEIHVEVMDIPISSDESDRPDGPTTIQQERAPLVSFAQENKSITRLRVKDYGKGIDRKHFNTVFQPFAQTNSGINNIDGGTGLGLAITEKLVEALGGSIALDSVMGQWTEFTVDLPFDEPRVDVSRVSKQFHKTEILYVGAKHDGVTKHVEATLEYFHVRYSSYCNFHEMVESIKSRSEIPRDQTYLCLAQGSLFAEEAFQEVFQQLGAKLVTLNQKTSSSAALVHYPSVNEIVPLTFMEELANAVQNLPESSASARKLENKNDDVEEDQDIRGIRVLIAEDNLVNQKILVRMLKRLGIEQVEVVDNGEKAVGKEANTPFDVVLMDMQMPVMDGVEATKRIVNRVGGHPIPLVIFVTAHVSTSFEAICMECGAASYLPKPYTMDKLKETLHSAVFHHA